MTMDAHIAAQRLLIQALRDPARHAYPTDRVEVIETHISFVLLTGKYAYKIKKAVDLGFVDYTDLDQRLFYCEEELRLNRRLAPQLYLAIIPITGTPENPTLGGNGQPFEYAVKMAEFAQQDLLDQALAHGKLTTAHVAALATTLAKFHTLAPAATSQDVYGSPQSVWLPLADNIHALQKLFDSNVRLKEVSAWCEAEYHHLEPVFRARHTSGWIRECHGDLHLGNMLLHQDQPVIFDCIEFNPSLRWIDVINDLAFLVMDLAAHDRPDLGWRLLNVWLENTGDYAGLTLLRFYMVYRALVRAQVAKIHANASAQPSDIRQAAETSANHYLDIAYLFTVAPPRMLLITHGFSGSGKSQLARQLAEQIGGICLRSDVERKRLHQLAPLTSSRSLLNRGLYSEMNTQMTYTLLAALAETVANTGHPVIIDATCLLRWQRDGFYRVAQKLQLPFLILDCQAPLDTLRARIIARHDDASDATLAVLEQQTSKAEPLDEEELPCSISVDTTTDYLQTVLNEIRLYLQGPRCL